MTEVSRKEACYACLYDEAHPFGLTFSRDDEGPLCSGCLTHQEKDSINWSDRLCLLQERIDRVLARRRSKVYDCVIPVLGDAEDYYVVCRALDLELRPLVVAVNDYFFNDIGWTNLHNLITHFDLDSIVYNPDMHTYKELVRTSLRKFNHILWPALALRSSFPVHIAKERKIPLIIWGQHQAVEQVGKFSHYDAVEMNHWFRIEHDLFRWKLEQVIGNGAQVNTRHLNYYDYPSVESLSNGCVTGLYLSNYYRWDPLAQNRSVLEFGFHPQTQNATFDPYERAGSSVYYGFHDLLKYKRLGYRKVRDHLSREIRHGRVSRLEAQDIERHYTQKNVDPNPFFDWLQMTRSGKRWFIEHRLQDVAHLIGEEDRAGMHLPEKLSGMIKSGFAVAREFITFGKGI